MSVFGDRWVALRNRVEAEGEAAWAALEPQAETAAVNAVKAGVAAAMSKGGTSGDMWVSARDAALSILESQGVSIGRALVEQFVTQELANPVAPTPPAAPAATA